MNDLIEEVLRITRVGDQDEVIYQGGEGTLGVQNDDPW